MTKEVFEVEGIEYFIGLNEKGYPAIFRVDGGLIHKQKPIIRKALAKYDEEVEKGDQRTTHELIRALSRCLNGDLEKLELENNLKRLNDFIADSDCLDEVYNYVNDINIFDILKLGHHEIRHSNMLAWLMDVYGNHGLGDYFVKKLLFDAISNDCLEIMNDLRPIDIDMMNLSDSIILRERDNIDILFVSEQSKLVFAIENKIDSKEHDNQLKRYYEILINKYPKDYHFVLAYLTPNHDPNSESEYWVNMDYSFIKNLLETIVSSRKIDPKAKAYIEDYIIVLRRNVVEDEQIKEICAKIYKKHGAALDLIFANKPDIRNIASDYIEKWLIEHAKEYDIFVWEKDWSSSFCRFIPNKLRPIFEGKSEGWCSYGYLVGFEIYLPAKGAIWLNIVIGPYQDQDYRQKVLDVALKYPEQFNVKKSSLSAKWKRIDNYTVCKKIEDLAGDDDEDSIDFDEKIGKKLKEYFDKLLDKKVECLVNELSDK